jgi:hypothetical protein
LFAKNQNFDYQTIRFFFQKKDKKYLRGVFFGYSFAPQLRNGNQSESQT